jgi:ABC-type transporter Mla MlaB component
LNAEAVALDTDAREENVLKITITKTPAEMRWVLQGRLMEPWVSELRANWKKAHRSRKTCTCVVDLNDVTHVDQAGEKLLRALSKEGAQFIANGLYIKHVLQQLKTIGKQV